MVGHPVVEARASETSTPGFASRSDLLFSAGATRGWSQSSPWPPARSFFVNPPDSPELINGEPLMRGSVQASMIGFDLSRMVETLAGFRRWALRQTESDAAWAESGSEVRLKSGSPRARFASLIPGFEVGPPEGASAPAAAMLEVERVSDAFEWAKLLSRPIVVLSVAAIAQVCWHYNRWRKLRRGPLALGLSKRPLRGLSFDKLVYIDMILPREHAKVISRPLFRRSRVS
jgi:hypothetical protein